MDYIIYNGQLYHHGVKGMKWGRRKKYQKTSKPTKSKHRIMLEKKYQDQGLSKQEAESKADKRIRTEKILAIAGAVTIAAATAYVVNKKLKTRADEMIKAGGSLQRIEVDGDGKLHDVFFAAKDKTDKHKYAGHLASVRMNQTGKAYKMDIGVEKDIKVAGNKKALDTFKKLYETNSEFKSSVDKIAQDNAHGGNAARGNIKKMYENFNTKIPTSKGRNNPAYKQYYDALKKEGYGAIRDINDMKFSGYNAKNPLILFDANDSVMVKNVAELSKSDVQKNLIKTGAEESAKSIAKLTAAGVPLSSLYMYRYDYVPAKTKNKRAR